MQAHDFFSGPRGEMWEAMACLFHLAQSRLQGSGSGRYTWTNACRLGAALSAHTPWEASGIFQQSWHHQVSNFEPRQR